MPCSFWSTDACRGEIALTEPEKPMGIQIRSLAKSYGELAVFTDLSLDLEEGAVSVILGPSGCGKTTLLNILSGVTEADAGTIAGISGRRTSYLFQEPRLLPWKSVEGNLDFVLRGARPGPSRAEDRTAGGPHARRGGPQAGDRELISRFLDLVGLSEFKDYYPDSLSGGMRQRVAIARAFAFPADLLIMDEPFQALDLSLKVSLMGAFEKLWQADQRTVLFVTHDVQEALLLGDVVTVLSPRPAAVVGSLRNTLPHGGRSLRDGRILDLERELYLLLGVAR